MKKRIVIGSLLAIMVTFQVSAQRVENDDMYFNSKDRERLHSEPVEMTTITPQKNKKNQETVITPEEENINPTDSYSARNINPEYISRSNSSQAIEDEKNYYVEGYTANTYDSYSSTKYTSTYSNSYTNSGYSPSVWDSYNNSYYGCGNPYYSGNSGWTLSLGYYSGNYWGSGWNYGMSYGYGNSYYSPYYPNYYTPYYGGYSSNYYSNSNESGSHNGTRPSRHSAVVTPIKRISPTTTSTADNSGSRIRQSSDEYYIKPFRRTPTYDGTSGVAGYSRNTYQQSSSTGYSRTRTSDSSPSYSNPTRSSSSSYSSPTRSSGGGGTNSSGGSRSRGRD